MERLGNYKVEHLGHYEVFDRELFVFDACAPDNIPGALTLPCPYFACLIAWDARPFNDAVLNAVATSLVRAGCVYVCCWGPDCHRVHDAFDEANMKLRPDGPWAMTTWHSKESLNEALWFLLECASPDEAYFDGCRAAIGVTIGSPVWAAEVRSAMSAPSEFIARLLAEKECAEQSAAAARPRE